MKSGLGTKNRQDLEATKVKDSKARPFILTSITKEVKKEKFRNAKKNLPTILWPNSKNIMTSQSPMMLIIRLEKLNSLKSKKKKKKKKKKKILMIF